MAAWQIRAGSAPGSAAGRLPGPAMQQPGITAWVNDSIPFIIIKMTSMMAGLDNACQRSLLHPAEAIQYRIPDRSY
jgi:hypothetical protein